ncbi:hypothetical protein Aperf_G00000124974 [Anoplocephala perfoliata]
MKNNSEGFFAAITSASHIHCRLFRSHFPAVLDRPDGEMDIAFTMVIHKDILQVARLLRMIHRINNYYCIHLDAKSPRPLREAVEGMARCFGANVEVVPYEKSVDVVWGDETVLRPQLICGERALERHLTWKYLINIEGQEFPLRTNLELIAALKALNGSNLVEAFPIDRFRDWVKNDVLPLQLNNMFVRSRSHSLNSKEEVVKPLRAFQLKNTIVRSYRRGRECPRNRTDYGNSVKEICRRVAYLLTFYTVLGLLSVGYLNWYMYFQVPHDHPTLTGMQSALQMNPGLSHLPNPDLYTTLLYFLPREPLPFYQKSDELAAYLHAYQDNTGSTELEDCVQEGGIKQNPERPCTYDLNAGGPCNIMNGYGFNTAQACIVLKMNRIYGWLPDPIDEFATGVLVKCAGVTADVPSTSGPFVTSTWITSSPLMHQQRIQAN